MKRIFALCLAFGAACFTGCADQESFTPESYTAKPGITQVCIDVRDRQIEVARSADSQIHLDYFENGKEYYDISVSDGHTLTMTAEQDKEWTDYIGGKSAAGFRKISLQLPDTLLESLTLSTTNEDISLPALSVAGDISLSSLGGSIVFEQLNVGKSIRLDSKNGDISGTLIGSYDDYAISCRSKKGKCNLPSSKGGGTKALTVSANNGDVDITFIHDEERPHEHEVHAAFLS